MLFNNSSAFTYAQLLQQTQLPELDMKCNLIPLLKFKILIKVNPGNPSAPVTEFNQSDVYSLFGQFKHNNYKIKIPVATAKDQNK